MTTTDSDRSIVVCSKLVGFDVLQNLSQQKIVPLSEFCPNGTLAVIVVSPGNVKTASRILQRMSHLARTQSIITGRFSPDETVPADQPSGTALLSWCSDHVFAHWLRFVQNNYQGPVLPEWFFRKSFQPRNSKSAKRLKTVLHCLPALPLHELKVENLAKLAGCSSRQLTKLFCNRLGINPGILLRAIEVTSATKDFVNAHAIPGPQSHGVKAFSLPKDVYRRRLWRLFGLTYSELLQAQKNEHWAAVLMRRWRHRIG